MRPPILAVLTAALILPAAAAADSLSLRVSPERVRAGAVARVFYGGAIEAGRKEAVYATLFSYLQPGRGACAPTQQLELNRPSSQQLHMIAFVSAGTIAVRRPALLPRPGLYRICAYLQHHALPAAVPDGFATALVRGLNPRH